MKKIASYSIVLVLCVVSFFAGFVSRKVPTTQSEPSNEQFSLLAKRLFIDNPNDIIINFSNLRLSLQNYFRNNNLAGSLYFEYLPTGTSIRVQGDEELVAASLMKMPVVMELYRAAELGRINLDTKIALKEEWLDSAFGNLYQKGAGYQLTLREAAQIALKDSDNTAIAAILNTTQGMLSLSENVINSLDVEFKRDEQLLLSISARSYASFLKCLYFSCYLSKVNSQEILTYLTQSSFNNRLRVPIPENIAVAHKIGTYSNQTQSDCGIIYEPNRNYILCIMLYVPDNQIGNSHIAELSRIAYEYTKGSEVTKTE